MGDINEFQSKLYNEVELPRLKMLIETQIKKEGTQTKFIERLNKNLEKNDWPKFSAPTISTIRYAEDTTNRTSGWDERRLLRLAVGLKLDSDPVIALAILRCYLLGLIELSSNSITAFKSITATNTSNFQSLVHVIQNDHPEALNQLMIHSPLTQRRVNELLTGATFIPDEITWVMEWGQKYGVSVPETLLLENHPSEEQTAPTTKHV